MYTFARWAAIALMLTAVAAVAAEKSDQLKARADAAHGGEQVKLCLEYARVQLETSNNLFTDGNVVQAQADIREVVAYAGKAADVAENSGKHLKDTEINLRKLAERMHDIGETLAFEDRQPVREAVDQLEKIRSGLIVRMWGPDAEPKGSS